MPPSIFLTMCAASVAGLLYAEHGDRTLLKRIFKPAAALSFLLTGIVSGALDTAFGQAILTGLAFCAIGDVLLIPKSHGTFLAGMGAFAAGHAAYIAAFMTGGAAWSPAVFAALVLMAVLSGGMLILLREGMGPLRIPVAFYSLIITIMVAAGVAHWSATGTPASAQLAVAAAGFALSDVSVARDRFGEGGFANRLWGLPLYFASQCLFAVNV